MLLMLSAARGALNSLMTYGCQIDAIWWHNEPHIFVFLLQYFIVVDCCMGCVTRFRISSY